MERLMVKKAAVLGAGVMGAQIAAHLANAGVPVVLFDLAAKEGDPDGIVRKALDGLKKMDPAPLAAKDILAGIEAANYETGLAQLADCDLVVEAIAEKMEWKEDLYRRIAPHLAPGAILASNTSGLAIARLAEVLPEVLKSRFCGIHFFNPPRYMALVELIAAPETAPAMLDALETWLTTRLGKSVVRAKDTPNFVANRVGVFSILAVMHHTARLGLGFDEVDALTGPKIGRPKSATYRTADVVGLDTLAHVVQTMRDTLPGDPWHAYFKNPAWLDALIGKGALGQKTRCGIFRKAGKEIQVLDLARADYRASAGEIAPEVADILKMKDPAARFNALRASSHVQARFLWAIFRDVFHYCAYHLADIADNARDVDLAMRWGFGWALGPFETWQAAGWQALAAAIEADIKAGEAMANAPLPAWVKERGHGVHEPAGSWSAAEGYLKPRSNLPVYGRQLYPERVLGEAPDAPGATVWQNAGVRLWTHGLEPRIAILSIISKAHTIGDEVLDGVLEAVSRAESEFDGLVIWHEPPFAVGANLQQVSEALAAGQFDLLEATVAKFQRTSMRLKYAQVPVVAAVQGMALGGGCEFVMHATRRVAALESYVGLVEAGVGLIPAGGGCKEFALQAARLAARSPTPGEVFPYIQSSFQNIAMANVAKSALEARQMGFMQESDPVLFHSRELLYVALKEARALAESGYAPPMPVRKVTVAGRNGIATLELMLVNMKEGGMISAHDYQVAKCAATALCGGDVETGSQVDEEWLLTVERRLFVDLLKTPETQARIRHMLETGKPLRN
ncbi:MAG: 3-hydroxyacyl-CoA dehydrogenase NAD-binding domain-containing protein [Rhodocyclaceae bacterium]|nr:3-hydroxyacyl-CoA dehydrogenase NAD-binding domain-containing protein [Rhodocyclaceae bacterium]